MREYVERHIVLNEEDVKKIVAERYNVRISDVEFTEMSEDGQRFVEVDVRMDE